MAPNGAAEPIRDQFSNLFVFQENFFQSFESVYQPSFVFIQFSFSVICFFIQFSMLFNVIRNNCNKTLKIEEKFNTGKRFLTWKMIKKRFFCSAFEFSSFSLNESTSDWEGANAL